MFTRPDFDMDLQTSAFDKKKCLLELISNPTHWK